MFAPELRAGGEEDHCRGGEDESVVDEVDQHRTECHGNGCGAADGHVRGGLSNVSALTPKSASTATRLRTSTCSALVLSAGV